MCTTKLKIKAGNSDGGRTMQRFQMSPHLRALFEWGSVSRKTAHSSSHEWVMGMFKYQNKIIPPQKSSLPCLLSQMMKPSSTAALKASKSTLCKILPPFSARTSMGSSFKHHHWAANNHSLGQSFWLKCSKMRGNFPSNYPWTSGFFQQPDVIY